KQEYLESLTGGVVKQSQISDLQRGRLRDPSGATWEALARAFGVDVGRLMEISKLPSDEIPSIVEVLPPDLAGLPGWARDFHRWGERLSPRERQRILDLARTLAEEAAERERAEVESQAETNPGGDERA